MTAGTVTFAFSPNVECFLLGRILQGVGSQGANQAAIALIMQVTESLQADMGAIEFTWGLGYMLGPCLGGFANQYAGFSIAHMPAAFLSMQIAFASLWLAACAQPSSSPIGAQARDQYALVAQEEGLHDDAHEVHALPQHLHGVPLGEPTTSHCPPHSSDGALDSDECPSDGDAAHGSSAVRGWRRLCNMSVFAVCLGIVGHAAAQVDGIQTRTRTRKRTRTHIHIRTHTHTHTQTRTHVRMHTHTHAHAHIHTRRHTHAPTRTRTHTFTHVCKQK